jgi:hypothetical protein
MLIYWFLHEQAETTAKFMHNVNFIFNLKSMGSVLKK